MVSMESSEKTNDNDQLVVNNSQLFDEFVSSLDVIVEQQKSQIGKIQDSTESQSKIGETLNSLVEVNNIRNERLSEIVSINKIHNLSLDNIAAPNVADWIGASSNVVLALFGAYAAFKVKTVFDDKQDSKVYAELEKFWEYSDDITQDIKTYFLLFPFKLDRACRRMGRQ